MRHLKANNFFVKANNSRVGKAYSFCLSCAGCEDMENTWGSDNARAIRLYEKYRFRKLCY